MNHLAEPDAFWMSGIKNNWISRRLCLIPFKLLINAPARGDVHPQARFKHSRDRIAQRPAMARSTRLAESIYKLKGLMGTYVTERG